MASAPPSSSHSPLSLYRAKLAAGELRPDPVQELAAEKLESLHRAVLTYKPQSGEKGWLERFGLGRLRSGPKDEPQTMPRGLYLYGPVGRGKSMLMDLFAETTSAGGRKRVHFQAFMTHFHTTAYQWRQSEAGSTEDPILRFARRVVTESWLLCLDELEVRDIADAMIVGRLFQAMLDLGAVIVITSNRVPDDLYKDGLQREKFLPFIDLLKEKLDLLHLASDTDYRLGRIRGLPVYHCPPGPLADSALDTLFRRLAAGQPSAPERLDMGGREIVIPKAAGTVARFTFADLCEQPLGPADYRRLAARFEALVVSDIPQLGPENRDAARRFVTLVDALYDHRTLLAASAAAPPESLYPTGDGAFEFQRTVSRLMEMQSEDYLGARHLT